MPELIHNIASKKNSSNLQVLVGVECNNSCMFCVAEAGDRDAGCKSRNEFLPKSIYRVLKESKGNKKVIFSRAEPTLNPDLINYVRYAKQHGYVDLAIISNGRMYSNMSYCLSLVEAGVTEFIVSIHGHNKKIHDTLTCSPGSFEQTALGLKNLSRIRQSLPIKVSISHVVNKRNYEYLDKFLVFLKQFLITQVVLNVVQPRGENMKRNFGVLMPRYKEVARRLENILETRSELFCSNLSSRRRFLSIIDLPYCISEKLVPFVGFGGRYLIAGSQGKRRRIRSPLKKKNRKCLKCGYQYVCEGVYSRYIMHFGWKEFKPIVASSQSVMDFLQENGEN